jgi:hypothetical protein
MLSPSFSRHREGDPQGKPMEVWVQERGKSEGPSVREGIGVEQTCNITPRQSGQTSTRSPLTREQGQPIKQAKQMTVTQTGAASHDIVVGWHEHSLASRSPQRASAPGTYCEGNEGRQMGQGESPATFAHPLVQRQGSCRATSGGKQRRCNPRSGRSHLGHSPAESNGHSHAQATRVSSSPAQACLYSQAKRQKAPSGHSLRRV